MKVKALLKSKIMLYLVLLISIVNVVYLFNDKNYDMIGLFCVTALLSTYFSKNMIINLLSAVIVTNLSRVLMNNREGLENKEKENDGEKKYYTKNADDKCVEVEDYDNDCQDGQCFTNNKCTEKFSQRNIPKSEPAKVDGSKDKPNDRIDYSSTLELAYDNLQNMLGNDGIKGLTDETKRLVKQQQNLMSSINGMAPVLEKAKDTLKNIDLPDMNELQKLVGGLKK